MKWNWRLYTNCDPKGQFRVMRFSDENRDYCFELKIDATRKLYVAAWFDTMGRLECEAPEWKYFLKPSKELTDAMKKAFLLFDPHSNRLKIMEVYTDKIKISNKKKRS